MVGPANAHIKFRGSISERSVEPYLRMLKFVREKSKFKGLLFDISSGGGGEVPSTDLYLAIKRVARAKPVVATIASIGASGGYMAALGAQKIYAYEGSAVGSIGVVMPHFAVKGLLDKLGIDVELLHQGRHKDAYQGLRPLTEEERTKLNKVGEVSYNSFVEVVAKERKKSRDEILKLATGEFWSGRQALQLGLIDVIGDRETALEDLCRMSGVPRDRTVQVVPPQSWMETLVSKFLGGSSETVGAAVGRGVRMAMEETLQDWALEGGYLR